MCQKVLEVLRWPKLLRQNEHHLVERKMRRKKPGSVHVASNILGAMDLASKRRRQRSKVLLLAAALLDLEDDTFRDLLDLVGRQRRDRRIPRMALAAPGDSAFDKLYNSGNDQALITVTGFDHNAFRSLLELFSPWYHSHTPWTGSQAQACN
jgi:hypothetical protein